MKRNSGTVDHRNSKPAGRGSALAAKKENEVASASSLNASRKVLQEKSRNVAGASPKTTIATPSDASRSTPSAPTSGTAAAQRGPTVAGKPPLPKQSARAPQESTTTTTTVTNTAAGTAATSSKPAPQLRVRSAITPSNKYAHVPSRVLSTPPPPSAASRTHGAAAAGPRKSGVGGTADKKAKKAMSDEDFFGPGVKKTEAVKSVLHKSRFMMDSKKATKGNDDGNVKHSGTPTRLSRNDTSSSNNTEETSMILLTSPKASAMSFTQFVMDAASDVPTRRSASQSNPNNSASALPPPSPQRSMTPPPGTASKSSTPTQDAKAGWFSWILNTSSRRSPIAPSSSTQQTPPPPPPPTSLVFPEAVEEETTRSSRWSVRANFGQGASRHAPLPAEAESEAWQTTVQEDQINKSNEDDVQRMSASLVLSLDGNSTTMTPPRAKAIPLSDSSMVSEDLKTPNELVEPAGYVRLSRRSTTNATPFQPPPPPNTPAEESSFRWDSLPRPSSSFESSRLSGVLSQRPSTTIPNAPPNTPAQLTERAPAEASSTRGSRRSSSLMQMLFGGADDSELQSPTNASEQSHFTDSEAQFDMPSPPPVGPTASSDGTQVAAKEGRNSASGGWMERIRTSLTLRSSTTLPLPDNETAATNRDGSPAAQSPAAEAPRRRKSVVFRSPDGLEVRVEDQQSMILGSMTPPPRIPCHNDDPASPAPILVRSGSGRLSGQMLPEGSPRSDSPSRQAAGSTKVETSSAPPQISPAPEATVVDAVSPPPKMPTPAPHRHTVSVEEDDLAQAYTRTHSYPSDALGRVRRSKTPGPRSIESSEEDLSPASDAAPVACVEETAVPSAATVSPMLPMMSPEGSLQRFNTTPTGTAARVESTIRNHTAVSAMRMLTIKDIATYLASNDVIFDPADKKARLFDTARKLVLRSNSRQDETVGSLSVGGSAQSRESSQIISMSRKRWRSEELDLDDDPDDVVMPTMQWTAQDIHFFAQQRGISLQGAGKKADMLDHITKHFKRRSPSQTLF